jgi:hypothetical protein
LRLGGLSELKKKKVIHLIGSGTRDLLACTAVPLKFFLQSADKGNNQNGRLELSKGPETLTHVASCEAGFGVDRYGSQWKFPENSK